MLPFKHRGIVISAGRLDQHLAHPSRGECVHREEERRLRLVRGEAGHLTEDARLWLAGCLAQLRAGSVAAKHEQHRNVPRHHFAFLRLLLLRVRAGLAQDRRHRAQVAGRVYARAPVAVHLLGERGHLVQLPREPGPLQLQVRASEPAACHQEGRGSSVSGGRRHTSEPQRPVPREVGAERPGRAGPAEVVPAPRQPVRPGGLRGLEEFVRANAGGVVLPLRLPGRARALPLRGGPLSGAARFRPGRREDLPHGRTSWALGGRGSVRHPRV
mmetsp:Transcript_129584/g.415483  ORF Transcript_129584/g.415483 Transcript_129584/m.415483 type:complete len:271 (+) Transcript_129584:7777-8589(+)